MMETGVEKPKASEPKDGDLDLMHAAPTLRPGLHPWHSTERPMGSTERRQFSNGQLYALEQDHQALMIGKCWESGHGVAWVTLF